MTQLHPDLPTADFTALGRDVIDLLAAYYADIETAPAFPGCKPADVAALFSAPPPEAGEPVAAILADWRERIVPNSSRQGSPRWFGFVNGSGSQIGALADAMASTVNPNCGGWRASPAATEIERCTVRWLAELMGYPADCGGVFVSGGTMANVAALRVALCAKAGWDIERDGLLFDPGEVALGVSHLDPGIERHHRFDGRAGGNGEERVGLLRWRVVHRRGLGHRKVVERPSRRGGQAGEGDKR